MRRFSVLMIIVAWVSWAHAQENEAPANRGPQFDPPTTDDPFLINGRSPQYQWPPGRHWLMDAPNDEERWRRLETFLDGMQGPMFEIGQRFVVFYEALRNENYAMADDIWRAIARVFVNALTIRPEYKAPGDAMFLRTQWFRMLEALETGDKDTIWQEFLYTKQICQSCHEATGMEWANVQRVFQYTAYPFDGASAKLAPASSQQDDNRTAQELFLPCTGCHTVQEGAPHLVGPNLHGIFGRKFGHAEGFEYSDALRQADIAVTDTTLNEWLTDTSELVPNNRMIFPGLRTQEERDKVIAYLRRVTQ
jgi:cytochrome c